MKLSGIAAGNIDPAVRPQDDLYAHVNGNWIARTELPPDKASWSAFDELNAQVECQLRAIIEDAHADGDEDGRKIASLYASFMDEQARGAQALAPEFARIDALADKGRIAALIARFNRMGLNAPYATSVRQDARDATRHVPVLYPGGLGLPDRDYYLHERHEQVRAKYVLHVETMLALHGRAGDAQAIVALETALAGSRWSRTDSRDPLRCYNPRDVVGLRALAPAYDWNAYWRGLGAGTIDRAVVEQPDYLAAFARLLDQTPLAVWKDYFSWCLLTGCARYLDQGHVDQDFAFHGSFLRGVPAQQPAWKRAVRVVEECMGEALGKRYVARHFPAGHRHRIQALVDKVMAACQASIAALGWMGDGTRQEAQRKLGAVTAKIGYPSSWRDEPGPRIDAHDLMGNVLRARLRRSRREIARLGQAVDRAEWRMTPQTVNAHYNPSMNEVVFPAAILQPPFFNVEADDAVNYGAIGAIIGHEICHGFDDAGRHYDGEGNLRNWWSADDCAAFAATAAALCAQYGRFSPSPGHHIDGALTLGENVADNIGLAVAYHAYWLSLEGREAAVIDGLTGDQRFYMGFAQAWRHVARDAQALLSLGTDPHAPPRFRVLGSVRNQAPFFNAFGVGEGDGMYLAPGERVVIW